LERPDVHLPIIQRLVEAVSQTARVGSLVFNHVLREWITRSLSAHSLSKTDGEWMTFFRNCMTLKKTDTYYRVIEYAIGDDYVKRYRARLVRLEGDSQALTYIAKDYITNFKTFIDGTFARIRSTTNRFQKKILHIGQPPSFTYYITGRSSILEDNNIVLTNLVNQLRHRFSTIVGRFGNHIYEMVCFTRALQKVCTKYALKSFPLAPIFSPGRKFVTIDRAVFLEFFFSKENCDIRGYTFSSEKTTWKKTLMKDKDLLEAEMRTVFKFDKIVSLRSAQKGYIFTGSFKTDGVALCVTFDNKSPCEKIQKTKISENDVVFGIDPGRCNIMFAYGKRNDEEIVHKLRRVDYHRKGHIKATTAKTQRWSNGIAFQGSLKSSKTSSFMEYIDYALTNWDEIWDTFGHIKFAKTHMTKYMQSNSVIDCFFNNLKFPGCKTIIGYGGAKFSASGNGRGEIAVPTTKTLHRCKAHFKDIRIIDEYRTSKTCPHCNNLLVPEYQSGREVRGIRRCDSNECRIAFHNHERGFVYCRNNVIYYSRDYVGAKNIYRCCFRRPSSPNHNDDIE
jgi:hypothetical protein